LYLHVYYSMRKCFLFKKRSKNKVYQNDALFCSVDGTLAKEVQRLRGVKLCSKRQIARSSTIFHWFDLSVSSNKILLARLTFEKYIKLKQDRQCTYNVTLRRVCKSLLPWESRKYYIFVCVCVRVCPGAWACVCARMHACSVAYPAWNSHVPNCDVICGLSVSTTFCDIIS
jgi:hypothetical protein